METNDRKWTSRKKNANERKWARVEESVKLADTGIRPCNIQSLVHSRSPVFRLAPKLSFSKITKLKENKMTHL